MQAYIIEHNQRVREQRSQVEKKRFNFFGGLKRISKEGFAAVCRFFDLQTTSDKIWFFGFYSFILLIFAYVIVPVIIFNEFINSI